MPHARHLPFGRVAVAQTALVVVFRLVRPHIVQDVLADQRMHVPFRMPFRHGSGLGSGGFPIAAAGLGVPFALAFDPVDGPIVGDPVPVVGQTTRGVDATEPVRVRW